MAPRAPTRHPLATAALAAAAAAALLQTASAVSNGHTFECDAHGNFGCDTFKDGNRLECTEPLETKGIMHWVTRPVHTDKYTLRAGKAAPADDETHYVPGGFVRLYLTVTDYDYKYKGLLMHAVDAGGDTVGRFVFPGDDRQLFWEPPECPGRLIHKSADLKPFRAELYWEAPAAGAGTVTFRTLIKRGEPNEGWFYRANPGRDLALAQAPAAAPGAGAGAGAGRPALSAARPGQSCTAFCAARGRVCDAAALRGPDATGADALAAALLPAKLCRPPAIAACSPVAPAVGPDVEARCYFFANSTEICGAGTDGGGSVPQGDGDEDGCAAADDEAARICDAVPRGNIRRVCGCIDAAADADADDGGGGGVGVVGDNGTSSDAGQTAPAAGIGRRSASASAAASSAPGARASGGLVALTTGLAMAALGIRDAPRATVALALLAAMPVPTDAHNWMMTPSRASRFASTTQPCRGRKSTDTHAQIGPGQPFVMKWVTGHGGDGGGEHSLVVAIHEDDYAWLAHEDFDAFVADYLENPPAGAENTALDPHWQRYHGVNNNSMPTFERFLNGEAVTGNKPNLGNRLYADKMSPADPNWLEHPFSPTHHQYRYRNESLGRDVRMDYFNPRYPWIMAAARYPHIGKRAHDTDGVRVDFPRRKGAGHYIVHWKWKGYSDCVDVDAFDAPVEHVDGVESGKWAWNKVDHCQYVAPQSVATHCHELRSEADGPEQCVRDLTGLRSERKCGNSCKTRFGINVVPLENPAAVMFPERVNVPFGDAGCDNHAAAQFLPGDREVGGREVVATTQSAVDWSGFPAGLDVIEGRCATALAPARRFRDAVAECTEAECVGFSIRLDDAADRAAVDAGDVSAVAPDARRWSVRMCTAPDLDVNRTRNPFMPEADGGVWRTLLKAARPAATPAAAPDVSVEISFQPSPAAVEAACAELEDVPCPGCASGTVRAPRCLRYRSAAAQKLGVGIDWSNWSVVLPEGMLADEGAVFGPRPGSPFDYGWRCPMPAVVNSPNGPQVYDGELEHGAALWPSLPIMAGAAGSPPTPWTLDGDENSTFVRNLERAVCADTGEPNVWEIDLPPGVYRVTTTFSGSKGKGHVTGCTAEGTRLTNIGVLHKHYEFDGGPGLAQNGLNTHQTTREIDLTEGRFRLSGAGLIDTPGGKASNWVQCTMISRIKIERVALGREPAWLPSSGDAGGAWWQMEIANGAPVGLVSVFAPSFQGLTGLRGQTVAPDCRSWWLLRGGSGCRPRSAIEQGVFDKPSDGAIITVSNTSCAGAACGGEAHVCGTIGIDGPGETGWRLRDNKNPLAGNHVGCGGAVGRFVRIFLPGTDRIFDNQVNVAYHRPPRRTNSTADRYMCYGVVARTMVDASTPEYIITDDPADPVFYSTCYVRDRAVTFVPPQVDSDSGYKALGEGHGLESADGSGTTVFNAEVRSAGAEAEWSFNGRCLECGSFRSPAPDADAAPRWAVTPADECVDCTAAGAGAGATAGGVGVLGTAGCDAEFEPPAYVRRTEGTCGAGAVTSADECFDAALLVDGAVEAFDWGRSARLPGGCSIVTSSAGAKRAFFNQVRPEDAPACGGSPRPAPAADAVGRAATVSAPALGLGATVSAWTDPGCAGTGGCAPLLRVVLRGPATGVWFGIAFDAFNMADTPYAMIVEPGEGPATNVSVSERRLGYHDGGAAMGGSVTVRGVEVADGTATVTVTRPLEVVDTKVSCVGLACRPTAEHGTFDAANLEMPVLLAVGFSAVYAHHRDKAAAQLAYDVDEAGVCLCTAPAAAAGGDQAGGGGDGDGDGAADSSMAVAAAAAGGAVAAVVVVAAAALWRRRRRLRARPEAGQPTQPPMSVA